MINIHVSSINRSGASLVTRLFDGHPDVASYPIEFNYPWNPHVIPFLDKLTGSPNYIPDFDAKRDKNILAFLGVPEYKPEPVHQWGKERADPIGVRKNYLERELYNKVKTDFDYEKFVMLLKQYGATAKSVEEVYQARHRAYFEAWEEGKYAGTMKYVATYGSGQLYISNMDTYFKEFPTSFLLCPIRDVRGYIASEKTRYARRYFGFRRFSYPRLPNTFVKHFNNYDLDAQLRSWLVAFTRIVLLQKKFGLTGRFVVYSYDKLVTDTETVMRAFCSRIGMEFDEKLLQPMIAHQPWGGSSHQGKAQGVSKRSVTYYPKVLSKEEIARIEQATAPFLDFLESAKETPLDMSLFPKEKLYDYDFQKKYFDDEEKSALYYAAAYRGRRCVPIKKPGVSALLALLCGLFVRIVHIPRLLKLRFFPGWGKQNYT